MNTSPLGTITAPYSGSYGKHTSLAHQDAQQTAFQFTKTFMTDFVNHLMETVQTPNFYGGNGGEMFTYFLSEAYATIMMKDTRFTGAMVRSIQNNIEKNPEYKKYQETKKRKQDNDTRTNIFG